MLAGDGLFSSARPRHDDGTSRGLGLEASEQVEAGGDAAM